MKYPRTIHVKGSLGRDKPDYASLDELPGTHIILEEKLDGSQVSIRFERPGQIVFQSRGTVLSGGPQEQEFGHLKPWAYAHANILWERLGTRYVMYGEWLYAKHTSFYDQLPHYFLEFDIWDTETQHWLSTPKRRSLLENSPVCSVPVLFEGTLQEMQPLDSYLTDSLYKSESWQKNLTESAKAAHLDLQQTKRQTATTRRAEGLYIKAETDEETVGRYKYICPAFLQTILDSGSHWKDRPLLPNRIQDGIDLFAGQ
jgi:hypothetical protein